MAKPQLLLVFNLTSVAAYLMLQGLLGTTPYQ